MKNFKIGVLALVVIFSFMSCFEDLDDNLQPASTLDIQNFIYKAMNIWYLYKPDVPDLANDRFATQDELDTFLNTFSTPEDLFDGLVAQNIDRFSFMVSDYRELEAALAGISVSNGMEFGLVFFPNSQTNVFGYVRYIIPNSDAAAKGLHRGVIFNTINGAQITIDNFRLLNTLTSYDIGLATFDGATITPTGETVSLNKAELVENPIHLATTLNINGQNIGYLMYNGFTADFDTQLNASFGQFKADAISDLIIDLRYNGGGSILTAIEMASMVTGQFTGQVFSTEVWNPEIQAVFEADNPEQLINRFTNTIRTGAAINSLNLNRLYVLTSARTASASELVINGLNPYIEVIQVGSTTTGKFQASTTFYDSPAPNFRRQDANPSHFYAIQPLIFTTANAIGTTGFVDGLPPTIELFEDYSNLGVLGDVNEPLLEAALGAIFGRAPKSQFSVERKEVGNSKMGLPVYERMYIDFKEYQKL
ncbi:MAG: peptidase S41 [Bacteroidetes bacterium HGW-Bacteroidetes-2]|jgi:C-terminal processing protease CtpA/Prc|nr:MAG: peptidase S41 [Bacteroidetes bacterium HGW-Bacteroidetes-2]